MPLKRFDFQEQFMICSFLTKLTQFDKTEPIDKTFISLGKSIIKFHFRNKKSITFLVTFTLSLFDKNQSNKEN